MISLCVCTYNRAEHLRRMLDTLAGQSGIDWSAIEVIVVDNNCTDHTASVIAGFTETLPLRRVIEEMQGLSHARNRAIKESRGDWIIFTDDDVALDTGWLAAYRQAFESFPDAAFAGGRITPYWNEAQPAWFRWEHLDGVDGLLVWYDLGSETRRMRDTDPEPFGASLALRRSLVDEIGLFRTDLGPIANGGRGDDTEFVRRARLAGASGVYVGAAHCKHLADPARFTIRGFYRHGVFKGIAHRAMTDAGASGSRFKAMSYLVRGVRQLLLGRGDRFRQCVINAGVQRGFMISARAAEREARCSDAD